MNNTRKIAILLVLLAGLSAFAFSETFYGFSTGLFRLTEQFFDDDYGKELNGINFSFDINYFPERFPFGWFMRGSIGAGVYGYEWTESNISSFDSYSTTDLRLSIGPSYKMSLGSNIVIPISFGPSVVNYREEICDYSFNISIYETINMGFFADAAIILIPFKWLFVRTGISASWDFIRLQRNGLHMSFRNNFNEQVRDISYNAYNICIYSGVGIRF